jgi:hypothetical protein
LERVCGKESRHTDWLAVALSLAEASSCTFKMTFHENFGHCGISLSRVLTLAAILKVFLLPLWKKTHEEDATYITQSSHLMRHRSLGLTNEWTAKHGVIIEVIVGDTC